MTAEARRVRKRLIAWVNAHEQTRGLKAGSVRHIHTRCYVLAKIAPGCIVVAYPWVDSEQHLQDFDRRAGAKTVNLFDEALDAGDWCSMGYVMTRPFTYGQPVAIQLVKAKP